MRVKVIAGRDPSDPQQDLASQPTLSRFENGVSIADLNRLRELFVTLFIQSFRESLGGAPPTRIGDERQKGGQCERVKGGHLGARGMASNPASPISRYVDLRSATAQKLRVGVRSCRSHSERCGSPSFWAIENQTDDLAHIGRGLGHTH